MKSQQDCALQKSSGQSSVSMKKSSAAAYKDDPSFYDSALASKLAAEEERLESCNPLPPSPLAESLAVDVPWYKQKCRLIIIAAVLGMVAAVSIVVFLVLTPTSVGGDDNDQDNYGASEELASRKNPEREAIIADRLAFVTPGGNETLMEPNSPQYRAWQWLVYDDEMKLDPAADHLQQRYLLMVIHFPSMLDESDDGQNWGSPVHECEWEEVQCKDKMDLMYEYGQDDTVWIDDAPQRIVTGLKLSQRLNGQVPEELSLLSFLQYLDLESNKLVGSLPSHIYELHKLDTLILSQNQLSNVDDIGEFKHLEHLSLSMNNFKGPLPTSFQNLKHLKTLDLHTNEFSGDLFEVITDFESLEIIDVAFNDFNGTISPLIGNMINLTTVLLGNNQFSGGIPEEIQFCNKLQDLSVEANHDMGGIVPFVLGQLTSLVYLSLSTCDFEGPLPASFGDLTKLKFLDVTFNNLDGALPKELGSATNLTTLGLAYNEFNGSIPSEFGLLTNLKELIIQNTNLMGTMPKEICTLRQEGILQSITASCDNLVCTCCDCN